MHTNLVLCRQGLMCKNYVLINIRVYILPKLSIFRITIFLYTFGFSLRVMHEFFLDFFLGRRADAMRQFPCSQVYSRLYLISCRSVLNLVYYSCSSYQLANSRVHTCIEIYIYSNLVSLVTCSIRTGKITSYPMYKLCSTGHV